ncbi:MAG: hypothetical protein R2932_42745 [Caldilineaceae bacterium]
MKIFEVRRHAMRKSGGGSQLSQAGVDYARTLGATLGPFAGVVTSVVPPHPRPPSPWALLLTMKLSPRRMMMVGSG